MQLTQLSRTATSVTLGWTPPAGVLFYEFFLDGQKIDESVLPTKSSYMFPVPDSTLNHVYDVLALMKDDSGEFTLIQSTTTDYDTLTAYIDDPIPDLTNAKVATSAAQFESMIANAVAGDLIHAVGTTPWQIPIQFNGFCRVISGGTVRVVIDSAQFDSTGKQISGVAFVGPDYGQRGYLSSGARSPAVYVHGSGGWRIWGGYITCDNGGGILVHSMPGPFKWTGFRVKDTADTCVAGYAAEADISGLILKGVAGTSDPVLAYDPHAEKGTGIHSCNIENATYRMRNSIIAIDSVDQATGAAMEIRTDYPIGVKVYCRAKNLGSPVSNSGYSWGGYAKSQVAGNVIQLWGGSNVGSLIIGYAEGNNIEGRILECAGVWSGADLSQTTLNAGRATGPTLKNTLLSRVNYNKNSKNITLVDCTPIP